MEVHISPALTSPTSRRNDPTIISHQQLRHPGMTLSPPKGRRVVQQEVERIRGGCLCPGGSVWVCSTGVKEDTEAEQAQEEKQIRESKAAQAAQAQQSPRILPAFEPPISVSTTSRPPSEPPLSGTTRKQASSLPTSAQRPDGPQFPSPKPGTRTTTASLPPRAPRPFVPPSASARRPRQPAVSLPAGPHPKIE